MAITAVTNHLVFPSENDVNGGVAGAGRVGQESTLAALWKGLVAQNCVVSGFSPIPTGAGFTKAIPGGEAVIDGYVVKGAATTNFTFSASETVLLYLRLNFSAGKVASVTLESFTGSTPPANSVLLAQVVTSGTDVTSQTDMRPQGKMLMGGTSTSPITFPTGYFFRAPNMLASTSGGGFIYISASSATSATWSKVEHDGSAGTGGIVYVAFL